MKVEAYYDPIEFLPSIDVKEFLITEDDKVDFLRSYIRGFEKYSLLDIKSVHYKTIEENPSIEFFIKTDVAININYGYIDRIYKITEFIEDSVTKKAYVEVVYEGIGDELSLED